jgi:histidinol dehydrogenase
MSLTVLDWQALDPAARRAALQRPALRSSESITDTVRDIIASVRDDGDATLRRLTTQFDGATLTSLRVSDAEIAAAAASLAPAALVAIKMAIRNVRKFHEAQLPKPIAVETMPGVFCERISHPIDAVGLYVPAGTAPLPSAAIMLAVPATIADCPTRVLCTPPRADGTADPAVITAACEAGVREIYKVGGAQAIAAMAYGTESIPRVCKIFGPGNAWVTAAKTLVAADAGGVAIDMPAGPSEVLVIADEHASAAFVAADLLSQAEHGADSQVILVSTSRVLTDEVNAALESQLAQLSRAEIAREALSQSRAFVVQDLHQAIALSNAYAPEHLILQVENPRDLLKVVRNAGSVFVGAWAPEAVGDYCSGTNHVLPTYGFARSYNGLGVDQFLRQMSVQELTRDGLAGIADTVLQLAGLEGLDAHAAAVRQRLEAPG